MKYIFIGYLIMLFRVNIGLLEFLPTFVGYIFIDMGIKQLRSKSIRFIKLKPWVLGMAAYSFLIYVAKLLSLNLPGIIALILPILTSLAALYILREIILGLKDIEAAENIQLNTRKMLSIWKVKSAIFAITATLCIFYIAVENLEILTLPILVVSSIVLVVEIVFLVQLYIAVKAF